MRVTHKMMVESLQQNLSRNFERLQRTHEEISTGKRIRVPSDDPPGAGQALLVRSNIQLNDQYLRTINLSKTWLETSEGALSSFSDVMVRAKELAIQGSNATLGATDRVAIADEVNQLVGAALAAANTNAGGAFLFAGHQTTTTPFTLSGSTLTYQGDSGQMTREIGQSLNISVNTTGDRLVPALQALISLRDALQSGTPTEVRSAITGVDDGIDGILELRAESGSKVNRFEFTEQRLEDIQVTLKALLSETEDVDFSEAISRFNLEENVYKASLSAGGKAIQPSLLDFLR